MKPPLDGKCNCGELRFRLLKTPLFVHCCHCSWCQRETGSAFALNAMIETSHVCMLQGQAETIMTHTQSGQGQNIARCPRCRIALWSHYSGLGEAISFVRVGTLEQPGQIAPDIHIFTSSKLPWVILPESVPAVSEYYQRSQYWPAASLERLRKLKESMQ